uniref:Ubiquinol oxidase n=1 Tax=Caulerpa cylindracea TaxID=219692 RepID=A0A2Z5FI51_9CHLO|nr:mitochondrial alternative oxidase [Caulerpa cylindracea]
MLSTSRRFASFYGYRFGAVVSEQLTHGPLQNTYFSTQQQPLRKTLDLEWDEDKHDFAKSKESTSKTPPLSHPSSQKREHGDTTYFLMQPVYTRSYTESIKPKHQPPVTFTDKAAYYSIQGVRRAFDWVTGYGPDMNLKKWLRRIIFLETVAGVPGMVGGMLRHLRSLRSMKRDHGWIHTLLEEAENERMHLLTFLQVRKPGFMFRSAVIVAQGVFFNLYFVSYLISPRYAHKLVGYLEEEAVKTYTHLLQDIDSGKLPEWNEAPLPEIAKKYWKLDDEATMRDLVLNVRADEACHSHVNHTFGNMGKEQTNPFDKHSHTVP